MKKTNSLKRITNLIAVMVILLGVIPFTAVVNITTVYADGEETTEPAVPAAEEAPEAEETAPTTEEDVETEGVEAAEEVDVAEEAEAEEEVLPEAIETVEEEIAEVEATVDVSEIVEALSEAEVQIVDESGETLPLASVEAVEVLAYSDPFLWDDNLGKWVGFADNANGCPANVICNVSATPFQAAVEYSESPNRGNVIYVASGNYEEDNVVVNTAGLSFTAFQTITVPDTNVVPVYTSGYALVNKITINVELGTIEGVYAKEVIVNESGKTGGRLDDAMALVNDGGTIEADMVIYNSGGQKRVKDAHHSSVNFEWECGEPNAPIWIGRTYRMTLMDLTNQKILDYYIAHGDERVDVDGYNDSSDRKFGTSHSYAGPYLDLSAAARMEDLLIGVNLSEADAWGNLDEERIYWYLLGNTGYDNNSNEITLTDDQQTIANRITPESAYSDIEKSHSVWFLWPEYEYNFNRTVSPILDSSDRRQLTFFSYETRVVYGCLDPEAENYDPNATEDNEDCVYPETPPTTTTALVPAVGGLDLITAGIGHTCALTAKEGLECWGLNEFGQVGDSSFDDTLVPVDVAGIDPGGVINLVSGIHHTCVLTSANEVFCWGLNNSGQLGDGTTENRNEPILVDELEGKIISISAGAEFTCALNDASDVFCWGNNSSGQLNDGTEIHSSIPVKTTTVSSDTVLISGGSSELQGITSDGVMQLWNSQPVIPVTGLPEEDNAFVSADRFTEGGCTMTDAGDVNCWGGITDAQVKGAVVNDMLSSGKGHACTMKPEGLVCWGNNSNGQLGDDSLDDSLEETLVTKLEQGVIALAAGMKHTCVIYTDETIACWGLNDYGQLGNDTLNDSMVPVNTK